MQEYILMQVKVDGLLTKEYIQKVGLNFGVCQDGLNKTYQHGHWKSFTDALSINVEEGLLDSVLVDDEEYDTQQLIDVCDFSLAPQ